MSDNDEQVKKDPQGEPKGHQNADGTVEYAREGDKPGEPDQTAGYQESQEHVPDPTSMSGTLETSGTGGGRHAHLSGISRAFGDVETFIGKVESFAHEKVSELVEGVKGMIREEEAAAKVQSVTQQTTEDGGLAQHEGGVVQADDTGHPAPADTTTEGASAAPVAKPEQPTLDGDKNTPQNGDESTTDTSADKSGTRRTPAKKAAASKNTGTTKK